MYGTNMLYADTRIYAYSNMQECAQTPIYLRKLTLLSFLYKIIFPRQWSLYVIIFVRKKACLYMIDINKQVFISKTKMYFITWGHA